MKHKANPLILTLAVLLTAVSCDRPACVNTNPIFDNYDMNSVEYKAELIKQVEKIGHENLSYWLESYTAENEKEYIVVNVQDDSLCAKAKILVTDWNKIEGIRRTKGKSYRGAKLKGLTFRIENDSNSIELIYEGLTRIAD